MKIIFQVLEGFIVLCLFGGYVLIYDIHYYSQILQIVHYEQFL